MKSTLLASAVLMLPLAQASTIAKSDYRAGKTRISANYTSDKAACGALAANAKDVCLEQAKARQKVEGAELTYSYSGKPGDRAKVAIAKADTAYAVAKEKCDDSAGQAKDLCVQEAKAIRTKALAEVQMNRTITDAGVDAAATERRADFKLAAQKCEALAGDAKTVCMADAKSALGKN